MNTKTGKSNAKLNIVPVSFEVGNGWSKLALSISGKILTTKIPSGYTATKPDPKLDGNGYSVDIDCLSLAVSNKQYWFDGEALPYADTRLLDDGKYTKGHLKRLFYMCLVKMVKANKKAFGLGKPADGQSLGSIDFFENNRLEIFTLMPPANYQNKIDRQKAETIFQSEFNQNAAHTIKSDDLPCSFRVYTAFGGIKPEAITHLENARNSGAKAIFDFGYGTFDMSFEIQGKSKSFTVKDGLITAFMREANSISSKDEIEFQLMAGINTSKGADKETALTYFDDYFTKLLAVQIQPLTRALSGHKVDYFIIGGGAVLMSKGIKSHYQSTLGPISFGDEFSNATSLLNVVK